MKAVRHSLLALTLTCTLLLGATGCKAGEEGSSANAETERDLVVYVTDNAQGVREQALSYGLKVKTIDPESDASRVIRAFIGSPTDRYVVAINPVINRPIFARPVPEGEEAEQLGEVFRQLKQLSKAGSEQMDRLYPSNKEHMRLAVFSDFQCPYCKVADEELERWKSHYGDKLEVEMIHYPLPSHEHAFEAAEAAECARLQGKFDPYRKALFSRQEDIPKGVYRSVAREVGLDQKAFSQCLDRHQTRKKVRQEQYFGNYLGVQGTPTLVVNGEVTQSFQEVQKRVEAKLGQLPQEPPSAESSSSDSNP